MKMGVFYESSRIVAGRFGGIAPRPLRQAESILAIARYFSLQQSIQQARRSFPFRFFFFSAQFAARGVARCDRWLQARHVTSMMKLSQVTNMDYTRIPLFSFSHFYFFPLRGASAIIFFFSDFLFFTFYYVLKFS